MIVQPAEAKVEQELLPRFAQLNRATNPGFYTNYDPAELAAITDFLSRLIDSRHSRTRGRFVDPSDGCDAAIPARDAVLVGAVTRLQPWRPMRIGLLACELLLRGPTRARAVQARG